MAFAAGLAAGFEAGLVDALVVAWGAGFEAGLVVALGAGLVDAADGFVDVVAGFAVVLAAGFAAGADLLAAGFGVDLDVADFLVADLLLAVVMR